MAYMRIIVDHLKLEHTGVFDPKEFFKELGRFAKDHSLQKRESKNFEQDLPEGKFIEWETDYWWKRSQYNRPVYRIRVLIKNLRKVDVMLNDKKEKMSTGNILIYIDGYLEHDYEHRWEETPLLFFFRTIYDKFVYHGYTERFEQKIVHTSHILYDRLEKFFNFYTHYKVVSKVPHFAH